MSEKNSIKDGFVSQFILPPLWQVIPLGEGTEAAVDALITEQYRGLPRDKYGREMRRLRQVVLDAVLEFADSGALEVIFPLGNYWGEPLSIAAVTAIGEPDEKVPPGLSDEDILKGLGVELGGELVDTDAGRALRQVEVPDRPEAAASPDGEDGPGVGPLRTISYYWQIPGGHGATFTMTSTISGPYDPELDPLVDAFAALNDAMAQAMTWRPELLVESEVRPEASTPVESLS
ncbi:hypothetical protein [Gryllotalpicola koreensis]|uniref:Uncharacterized protein n=1 Tax=Gryllotalpicola koreensis TaxID=993086 RepID=A0ABP7ZUW9_9MICO